MTTLTIYSRPGCHLCDEMKAAVTRVLKTSLRRAEESPRLEEIDISGDPNLEALYGMEVPVLLIDGRKVAKYRISEDALLRALSGA